MDSNYKMSKSTKRILSTFYNDDVGRAIYKRCMVQAENKYNKKENNTQSNKSEINDKEY